MNRHFLTLFLGLTACGGQTTASHGVVAVAPASLDFGSLAPGAHASLPLQLSNEGNAHLLFSRVTLQGDTREAFSIGVAPTNLAAGETAELVIVYVAPTAPGPDSATLVIETDSRITPELRVSIVGFVERHDDTADAGEPDAGGLDAGGLDAGGLDAGDLDAGDLDAGDLDAGDLDAGDLDAGDLDAGDLDAGDLDAGDLDAGAPDAGTRMKYVFTSSRAWEGDLVFAAGHSGLSGSSNASILCNNVARDAGLGSSTAIITQPGRDPATYLPLNGPWYRTDGELVFATRDELLAGTPRVPINLDERGQSPGGYGSAWTGLTFSADGGLAPSTRACDGWTTSNAGTLGTSGSFSATNATWLNAGISNGSGSSCSTALHLYCIEH